MLAAPGSRDNRSWEGTAHVPEEITVLAVDDEPDVLSVTKLAPAQHERRRAAA